MGAARDERAQGGVLEQIDDCVTGFLVPINDAKTAAEKLGVLVNSPFIRSKMGEAGKQKLQTQFSEEEFNVNIVHQICSFV